MLFRTKLVATLAAGLIASSSAFAGAIVPIVNENRVFDYDPISIGFSVNFFGESYSELSIYDLGFIVLGNSGPWIAPLYNTFSGGYGFERNIVTYGNITYEGHTAFAVTWVDHKGSGGVNEDFQLVLVDRSDIGEGNFDFIFNFDYVNWPYGAQEEGYVGVFGYTAPGGFFGYDFWLWRGPFNINELPYHHMNSDVAGRYVFEVRDGVVTNPLPLLYAVPEPETWAMLLAGLGIVGTVTRRQRARAAM